MAKHARLSASAAERWVNCPGSIELIETMPADTADRQTSYAYRGTVLHAVARRALLGRPLPAAGALLSEEGGPPYEITENDLEGLSLYLTLVNQHRIINPKWEGIEVELDLTGIHPQLGGTADYAALLQNGNLVVIDLKTGTGITVNPENNLQCILYAMGVWVKLRGVKTITIIIVQPWAAYGETVKPWSLSATDLMGRALDLMAAAERVNAPEPELKVGDWCGFCPAISICPKHVESFQELSDMKTRAIMMDDDTLGRVLVKFNQIKPWLDTAYEIALRRAEQGVPIPGMKLVPKRANRKWKDEELIPAILRKQGLTEDEHIYTKKIVSPAQAEKIHGKVFYKAYLEAQADKVSSGFNLVPVDDAVKGPDLTPLLPSPKSLGLTK